VRLWLHQHWHAADDAGGDARQARGSDAARVCGLGTHLERQAPPARPHYWPGAPRHRRGRRRYRPGAHRHVGLGLVAEVVRRPAQAPAAPAPRARPRGRHRARGRGVRPRLSLARIALAHRKPDPAPVGHRIAADGAAAAIVQVEPHTQELAARSALDGRRLARARRDRHASRASAAAELCRAARGCVATDAGRDSDRAVHDGRRRRAARLPDTPTRHQRRWRGRRCLMGCCSSNGRHVGRGYCGKQADRRGPSG